MRLLTLPEAAAELSCSLATVKRRVATGTLPVVRDGRLVRMRATDLERYLLEHVERRLPAACSTPGGPGIHVPAGARLWD
jgi:excisionase family DNA binding protein